MNKNFAIIGTAGYIAPRHLKAIKEIGGNLVAALDIADSVGILDAYFPDCEFFKDEFSFYDFLMEKTSIDYLIVCKKLVCISLICPTAPPASNSV